MTDIVDKPPWPDCMMPDGGEACKYVAWQADEIERLKAECAEQRRLKEGYYNEAADGWAAAAEKDREIDRLRRENNSLRGQPND